MAKTILSTGTPALDSQQPLPTEGNSFVCQMYPQLLFVLTRSQVLNWRLKDAEFVLKCIFLACNTACLAQAVYVVTHTSEKFLTT